MIFFFFSSRRRHTRSLRDWSSDVCSSDLDERADDLLDEEGIATGTGLDPGGERRKRGIGSEPVVEQRRGVLGGEGRQRQALDPCGPRGPILGPRGREQQ